MKGPAAADARIEDRPNCQRRDPCHAFVQYLRRGHYELGVESALVFRLATAFGELQLAI